MRIDRYGKESNFCRAVPTNHYSLDLSYCCEKKASEYDQEISQSHTVCVRATEQ